MLKIKLTQAVANKLMSLYREMDAVKRKDFDQEDCERCVIGQALLHGVIKTIDADDDRAFDEAIRWVGLPLIKEDLHRPSNRYGYSMFDDDSNYEFGLLGNYLFGNSYSIPVAAKVLGVPVHGTTTPHQAQKRIQTVLKMAGFDVEWSEV